MFKDKYMGVSFVMRRRTKELGPKIYAVLLGNEGELRLWMGTEYTLEDAIKKAARETSIDTMGGDLKCLLYQVMSIKELSSEMLELDTIIDKDATSKKKGQLMSEIIANNDKKLLAQNIRIFTSAEMKFMEGKMSPRIKKTYGKNNGKKPNSRSV